jgi:hypothetical protein
MEEILFGGGTAPAGDSVAQAAQDSVEAAANALTPFSSLLYRGDIIGMYMVEAEDADVARYFLSLPEVESALPRGQVFHWGGKLVQQGVISYEQLYVLTEDPFQQTA